MKKQILSSAQADFKMALWQVDAESISSSELYVWLNDSGLPHEVNIRLHEIATYTQKVGSKTFDIGKIILVKIIEFVKAHPCLVVGAGIGAIVGAAIAGLMVTIPFLGPLLAPVAMALKITITALGIVIGHNLDKSLRGLTEDIIEIAQDFFKLLADVFNAIFRDVITA